MYLCYSRLAPKNLNILSFVTGLCGNTSTSQSSQIAAFARFQFFPWP
jgi:hypothetical protein